MRSPGNVGENPTFGSMPKSSSARTPGNFAQHANGEQSDCNPD